MKRDFKVLIKAATRRGDCMRADKSAIAKHAWNHDHPILWDDIRVLEVTNSSTFFVGIHIHLAVTDKLLNRGKGIAIPRC